MRIALLDKRDDRDGRGPYLSGVLSLDVARGSIVLLKKLGQQYELVAVSDSLRAAADPSAMSLGSFVDLSHDHDQPFPPPAKPKKQKRLLKD